MSGSLFVAAVPLPCTDFCSASWDSLGKILWLPGEGSPGKARCKDLVCPTYLGSPLFNFARLRHANRGAGRSGAAAAAAATRNFSGLPRPLRWVHLGYAEMDSPSIPVQWEAFFEALGIRRLQPLPMPARLPTTMAEEEDEDEEEEVMSRTRLPYIEAASRTARKAAARKLRGLSQTPLAQILEVVPLGRLSPDGRSLLLQLPSEGDGAESLARRLVSADWWRELMRCPPSFAYVSARLGEGEELTWLRGLRVRRGDISRRIDEHFLQGSPLDSLGGLFVATARLPLVGEVSEAAVSEARSCLRRLHIQAE
ncbi:unnamed protein product, partial [Symbiodinium sp. CCMP2456]